MAVVLPAIVSIGSAMAGGAAFGAAVAGVTSTFAGFMSVAGAVLGGLGAITGNKGLKKLGTIMSLTGGVASLATSAFGAASAAGDAAGFLGEGAASGIGDWDAAALRASAGDAAALGQAGTDLGGEIGKIGFEAQPVETGRSIMGNQLGLNGVPPVDPTAAADMASTYAATPSADMSLKLPDLAKTLKQGDIAAANNSAANAARSLWDQAGAALKGTGEFIRNNKELVQMGGNMLSSMYGPEAERLDYEKSLMERARRNRNAPIRLKYQGGGG